jgi:YfiH family protein
MGQYGEMRRRDFNLSFNVGDVASNVLGNRRRLSEALDIPLEGITTAKQVHGHHVRIVDKPMAGKGAGDYHGAIPSTDAMVTDIPGICTMVLVADCVPILLYDPNQKVIGAVHAGWKGTLGRIVQRAVGVFREHFNSFPEDLVAGIGPSIGPCCFQVGPEVVLQIEDMLDKQANLVRNRSADGTGYFDLWKANYRQLVKSGLKEQNVELAGVCTYCDSTRLYFSHRHEKGKAGRFGAGIVIR